VRRSAKTDTQLANPTMYESEMTGVRDTGMNQGKRNTPTEPAAAIANRERFRRAVASILRIVPHAA